MLLMMFDGSNNANYNGFLASLTKQSENVKHLDSFVFNIVEAPGRTIWISAPGSTSAVR